MLKWEEGVEEFELETGLFYEHPFDQKWGRGRAGLVRAQPGGCAWMQGVGVGSGGNGIDRWRGAHFSEAQESLGWPHVYLSGRMITGSAAHDCPCLEKGRVPQPAPL